MARDNDDLAKTKADGTEKTDGTYMPRGDLAKYLVEEANLDSDPPKATQFSDTSGQDQISDYVLDKSGAVESMSEHGIVDGYSDGTVSPDDAITREQMAKMANLEYDLPDPEETTFADGDNISNWADSSASGLPLEATIGKYHEERGQTADNYQKPTDPIADNYQVEMDQTSDDNPQNFKGLGLVPTYNQVEMDEGQLEGDDLEGLNLKHDDALDSGDTLVAGVVSNVLGQALDASAPQGAPNPGPDVGIAAPFIPGSAVLSAAEPDEDDFKNNDTEEA